MPKGMMIVVICASGGYTETSKYPLSKFNLVKTHDTYTSNVGCKVHDVWHQIMIRLSDDVKASIVPTRWPTTI